MEDNAINAELACTLLERADFEVRVAATARDALQLATELEPDLILMDLRLPDGDGLSVVRSLRTRPGSSETPIIALTAYAMLGDEAKVIAAGCDGYIPKPIDTRSFTSRIREVLAARGS